MFKMDGWEGVVMSVKAGSKPKNLTSYAIKHFQVTIAIINNNSIKNNNFYTNCNNNDIYIATI